MSKGHLNFRAERGLCGVDGQRLACVSVTAIGSQSQMYIPYFVVNTCIQREDKNSKTSLEQHADSIVP